MGGVQFQKVGGGAQTINDLIIEDSSKPLVGAGTYANADQLDVWDNASGRYDRYYFGDWGGGYAGWEDYDKKWYPEGIDAAPAGDEIPVSTGFRLTRQSAAAASIIMSGEVVATNVVVKLKAGTINQISNPYPVTLKLQDVSVGGNFDWINSGLAGAGTYANADQLNIWNPTTQKYDRYYFGDWGAGYVSYNNQWYPEGIDAAPVTGIEVPIGGSLLINLNRSTSDVNLTLIAPNL